MKRIAIFVSGAGESAERIVKLFNEGNRLKTVLVVVDDSALSLIEKLKDEDITLLHIPDAEWEGRSREVADMLKTNDVKLIVLDEFALSLSDEILEATNGEMLRVSTAENAPREVVAAIEADWRRPMEVEKEEEDQEENPTPESEWAKTLNIRYRPPKVPTTPPRVPHEETPTFETPNERVNPNERINQEEELDLKVVGELPKNEPMPSTWLIWSILVTVFCCFIPGIIAIIFSSQVSSKYFAGDLEGARKSSRMAEIWIIVSFVLGVLSATLYLPFMMIGW